MPIEKTPFIAFATHPHLRRSFVEAKPLVVIDAVSFDIVWANASGAQLFAHRTISSLIEAGAPKDSIIFRQFRAAAATLSAPGAQKSFTINLARRLGRVQVAAKASRFALNGNAYIAFECEAGSSDRHSLVEGLTQQDGELALVDGDGTIVEQSDGFSATGLNMTAIKALKARLAATGNTFVESLESSQSGIWSLQFGTLNDEPPLFLLFVSGEIGASLAPAETDLPRTGPAETRSPSRSALDVIAAIDASLGALETVTAEIEEAPPSPVRRITPEPEPVGEDGEQARAATAIRPARFVWRTDATGTITDISNELGEAINSDTTTFVGLSFAELENRFGVLGGRQIDGLVREAETWSGRTIEWPLGTDGRHVPIDLAALPTYTRERYFDGFRGFGLVRLGEETIHVEMPQPEIRQERKPEATDSSSGMSGPNQLSDAERRALGEIADRLKAMGAGLAEDQPPEPVIEKTSPVRRKTLSTLPVMKTPEPKPPQSDTSDIDDMATAILIQAQGEVLHANPAFLSLSGYGSRDALVAAGGPDALLERGEDERLFLLTADGGRLAVSVHLRSIIWQSGHALAMSLMPDGPDTGFPHTHSALQREAASPARAESIDEDSELGEILETATDGILIIDQDKRVRSLSISAQALFGIEEREAEGMSASELFARESRRELDAELDRLLEHQSSPLIPKGLELIAREAGGGLIPLFMTLGRLPRSGEICAVMRDITDLKKREDELRTVRRDARQAETERDMFLAVIRQELRQPLDAIVSLSETMNRQTFGPLGDDHYHALAREISSRGRQARATVKRLLGEIEDAETAEAARAALAFPTLTAGQMNDTIAEAVSLLQPRANGRRIIIRTSLSPALSETRADFENLRRLSSELLKESIQFTPAGGQIVVSTARAENGDTILRFRDNGIAPERRHVRTDHAPHDKAEVGTPHIAAARQLAEAMGGHLDISSVPSEGMVVLVHLRQADSAQT